MQKQDLTHVLVRLPPEVNTWLEAQATANVGSKNSEIVRCIREKIVRQGDTEFAKAI